MNFPLKHETEFCSVLLWLWIQCLHIALFFDCKSSACVNVDSTTWERIAPELWICHSLYVFTLSASLKETYSWKYDTGMLQWQHKLVVGNFGLHAETVNYIFVTSPPLHHISSKILTFSTKCSLFIHVNPNYWIQVMGLEGTAADTWYLRLECRLLFGLFFITCMMFYTFLVS